jgi:hypothetical protein
LITPVVDHGQVIGRNETPVVGWRVRKHRPLRSGRAHPVSRPDFWLVSRDFWLVSRYSGR